MSIVLGLSGEASMIGEIEIAGLVLGLPLTRDTIPLFPLFLFGGKGTKESELCFACFLMMMRNCIFPLE